MAPAQPPRRRELPEWEDDECEVIEEGEEENPEELDFEHDAD